jgi:molybdopterin converting factor small subunit
LILPIIDAGEQIMPRVRFTSHLRKFFPGLDSMTVEAETVADLVAALNRQHPGIADYLIDEQGALRKHVNIFVGETLVHDRRALSDTLDTDDEVYVMQALSGG